MQLTVNFGWRRAASKYYTTASTHSRARWGQKKGAMTGQIHARLVAHTPLCNPSRHSKGRNRREKREEERKKKEVKANHRLFNALLPFPFHRATNHTTSLNFKSNRRFEPRQNFFSRATRNWTDATFYFLFSKVSKSWRNWTTLRQSTKDTQTVSVFFLSTCEFRRTSRRN